MDTKFDVVVIGAGVFGAWTALHLCQRGASVLLVDSFGPGNTRSSSGGESRVIRMGYGGDDLYTRSSRDSLIQWRALFAEMDVELFKQTGVLWLARENDPYSLQTLRVLGAENIPFEKFDLAELKERFPQIEFGEVSWGILEPSSGVLLARDAVQTVVNAAIKRGVIYLRDTIPSPLESVDLLTTSGRKLLASHHIFACGPWLPKLFPDLLADLIQVTRQEVFFFGVPAGDDRFTPPKMPVMIDFHDLLYTLPEIDGRGFKLAIDAHGPDFDPDSGDRVITQSGQTQARKELAQRIPALTNAPILETRVCQYENSSNGDFLIDRHPALKNVWLVGGGSGHGFKHGPVVGEYVAGLVSGDRTVEPRFTLATKSTNHSRQVY